MTYTYSLNEFPSTRDKKISFVIAFSIHLVLFFLGGRVFVKPVQFGVESGVGSLEVSLVSALPGSERPVEKSVLTQESDSNIILAEEIKSSPVAGLDSTTLQASGGAMAAADYFKNPAPRYPELSRKNGEEGLVLLFAWVNKNGFADSVEVKRASGYPLLDEAALRAVRRWKFKPAEAGGIRVDAQVEVPIRFQLKENKK